MFAWLSMWWRHAVHMGYQGFLVLDQLGNWLLALPFPAAWRGTWADETLSSRAYRAYRDGKVFGRIFMPLIDALFFWQTIPPDLLGHCHFAYEKEKQRLNSPPEQR